MLLNKCCTFYSSKNPENIEWFPQKYELTVFNIDNNKCFISSKSAY